MNTRTPRRDASLVVKLWITASALLLFGSLLVQDRMWRENCRWAGQLSLLVSIVVGIRQAQSREPEQRD